MTDNPIFAMSPMRPLTVERWVYASLETRDNAVSAMRRYVEPLETDALPSSRELLAIPSEREFLGWLAVRDSIIPLTHEQVIAKAQDGSKMLTQWRSDYLSTVTHAQPTWPSLEAWLQAEREEWAKNRARTATTWGMQCTKIDPAYFCINRQSARLPAADVAFIEAMVAHMRSTYAELMSAYFQSPHMLASDRAWFEDNKAGRSLFGAPNPVDPLEIDTEETEPTELVTLRLDKTLVEALRGVAAYQKRSVDELYLEIFKDGLPSLTLTME